MLEQVLIDVQKADPEWNVVLLRYFNPIGAHPSGKIGEDPNGIPNNLMPYITQTAVGIRKELGVFGNDYDTPDGTGVRDYIHVCDLASGHVSALKAIENKCGLAIYNLGTGHGYSVLDVVNAFEKVNGVKVPYSIKPQTPQAASIALLKKLYGRIAAEPLNFTPTDEASILEYFGETVYIVKGNNLNDKLTTPEDFEIFASRAR